MRLRRSNSTPSDTRPGDEPPRATDSPRRSSAATRDQRASARRSPRSPALDAVDRPAGQPRDRDRRDHRQRRRARATRRPRRGRAAGSRAGAGRCSRNYRIRSAAGLAGSGIFAPRMSDAIALRNRFAMVKGAWDDHLRGVPFPALGEGTAEEKIERLELALVDEMRARATPETAEQAADAMWGLVHARPGRRSRQAAGHARTTRISPGWATACADGLVAGAGQHGQPRVLRIARVGSGAQAQRERRAAGVADHPLVPAGGAQAGLVRHAANRYRSGRSSTR